MGFGIGRDVSFTWTTGGADAPTVANFNKIFYVEERAMHETTPPGYVMRAYTEGILTAYGMIGGYNDAAANTPPASPGSGGAPVGFVGTLVFTTATGQTKTLRAFLTKLSMNSTTLGGSPPQDWQYAWVGTATTSSEGITTA